MSKKSEPKALSKTYEESLARLEEILELMNGGKMSLEDSLKLFQEANVLLTSCNQKLTEAEKKIEMLIKKRNGEIVCGEDGEPLTEEFPSENT